MQKPPDEVIELRLVIWGTRDLRLGDQESLAVQIRGSLDCNEYCGMHPAVQETDVHNVLFI